VSRDSTVRAFLDLLVRRRLLFGAATLAAAAVALGVSEATSSALHFQGARYGNPRLTKPRVDPRTGHRVLLALDLGDALIVDPGSVAFPGDGTFDVRARLAVAERGAAYLVSAGFGSDKGTQVVVDSPEYRWYELGRLNSSGRDPLALRFDSVIRPKGSGLYIDEVDIRSPNQPTAGTVGVAALLGFAAAVLVGALAALVGARRRRQSHAA
jgi:hypothetical protein